MGVMLATIWVHLAQTSSKVVRPPSQPQLHSYPRILISTFHFFFNPSPLERPSICPLLFRGVPGVHVRSGDPRVPRRTAGVHAGTDERLVRPRRVRPRELGRRPAVPLRVRAAVCGDMLLEHRSPPGRRTFWEVRGGVVPSGVHG